MPKETYTPTVPSGPPKESTGDEIDLDGELAPGDRAGEYLILGTIASGGCGTVYTAEHRVLGRKAAVKVLHSQLASSPEMVERFVREARVVNRIRHPNIVDIYEFGELPDKRPYFVMELLEGTSLANIVERRGRLTPAQALNYLEPICDALRAAHSTGVVHRDLKASNVAVVKDGDPPRVKLLDFGIAKLVRTAPGERGLTAVGQRIGTPYAMAPEQIRGGSIDGRVDIYALGVLLYQLLTGRYPFVSGDPVEMERLHVEAPPPRPSAMAPVSPDIDAIVLRCMEKDASRRFPDVAAFVDALRAAVKGARAAADGKLGVAVYIEVRITGEQDDALLAHLVPLLDETELALRENGFALYLQTGSALLGVKPLSEDAEAAREERKAAIALARKILEPIHAPGADPRLKLAVHVHAAAAQMRGGEITGGSLVDIESWAKESDQELSVTETVKEGLHG
ncbi:MAG TPA: serine/threonine-protein kinase [Myxococcales bacterium]|jgi:serine/threonine-protein kinase|nr:serine/threonine-protein kinase [Myxococcales bacterium]